MASTTITHNKIQNIFEMCSDWDSAPIDKSNVIFAGRVNVEWNGSYTTDYGAARISYVWPDGYEKCNTLTISIPHNSSASPDGSAPGGLKAFFTTKDLGNSGIDEIYKSIGSPSDALNTGCIASSEFYSDENCLNKISTGTWIKNGSFYISFNLSNVTMIPGATYYVYIVRNTTSRTSLYGSLSVISTLSYKQRYTITFNANGGSFGNSIYTKTLTKYEDELLALSSMDIPTKSSTKQEFTITGITGLASNITQTAYKHTNFSFSTWNTKADGSGTSYASNGSYSTDSSITLYAVYGYNYTYSNNTISGSTTCPWWTITKDPIVNATYKVTFNGNGGTCTVSSLTANKITTYKLDGWYSSANGVGTKYSSTSSFQSQVTIYANWIGTISTGSITLPAASTVSRKGYDFINWNTVASGTGTKYSAGSSYTPTADITLYAFYEAKGLVRIYTGADYKEALVWVFDGTNWIQAIPNIFNGSEWKIGG